MFAVLHSQLAVDHDMHDPFWILDRVGEGTLINDGFRVEDAQVCVQVAKLPLGGLVEVECVAFL